MQIDVMEMLNALTRSHGIQVILVSDSESDISQIDYGFRASIYKDFTYSLFLKNMIAHSAKNAVLFLTDDFHISYCFFEFPDALKPEYHSSYCIIGPIAFHQMSRLEFLDFMSQHHLPETLSREVQEFFNRIPILPSSDYGIAMMAPFFKVILGEHMKFHFVSIPHPAQISHLTENDSFEANSKIASDALEERYKTENQMLEAVAAGNLEEAMKYRYIFQQFKITSRAADPLRNKKDLNITFNTLLRKAVQNAHVHPLYIDSISTQFATKTEACTSEAQLKELSNTMLRKYCMLVKNYSRKAYSALVQTCMDYIDFHYKEDLSLDTLAKICNVSNSYLSSLFKKETDVTITDYINTARIRHSLLLLNSTSLSMQTIAEQCGFSDSNYFARIFKKYQGQSPKQYRDTVKKL